jgi:hypothetical protein
LLVEQAAQLALGLRARLRSADRFSERAIAPGLRWLKTPLSSVRAWLSRVTLADHFFLGLACFPMKRERLPMASVAAATHLLNGCCSKKECGMADKQQVLKAQIDDKLDQALKDSFPASDPVSFLQPVPMKDSDRKLPVVEAANDSGRPARARKAKATRS